MATRIIGGGIVTITKHQVGELIVLTLLDVRAVLQEVSNELNTFEFRLDGTKINGENEAWCATDKYATSVLNSTCKCYITPFFSCLITIWRC